MTTNYTSESRRRQLTGGAVLSEFEVARIKALLIQGTSRRNLAEHYQVGYETIARIDRGTAWGWVEPLAAEKLDSKSEAQLSLEIEASKQRFLELTGQAVPDQPVPDQPVVYAGQEEFIGQIDNSPPPVLTKLLRLTETLKSLSEQGQPAVAERLLEEVKKLDNAP